MLKGVLRRGGGVEPYSLIRPRTLSSKNPSAQSVDQIPGPVEPLGYCSSGKLPYQAYRKWEAIRQNKNAMPCPRYSEGNTADASERKIDGKHARGSGYQ